MRVGGNPPAVETLAMIIAICIVYNVGCLLTEARMTANLALAVGNFVHRMILAYATDILLIDVLYAVT